MVTYGQSVNLYEAVHPLGGLCKQNKDNLQMKRGRRKASYLLNYSFAPHKTFRFVLSMHKSIDKHYYTARNFGGVQLHIYQSICLYYLFDLVYASMARDALPIIPGFFLDRPRWGLILPLY